MITRLNIQKRLLAVCLMLTIALPSFVQMAHHLEGHEHKECKIAKTHLHEQEVECSIDQFHFSSFDFQFFTFTSEISVFIEDVSNTITHFNLPSRDKAGIFLRGPPKLHT